MQRIKDIKKLFNISSSGESDDEVGGGSSSSSEEVLEKLQRITGIGLGGGSSDDEDMRNPSYETTPPSIGEHWGLDIPKNIKTSYGETDFLLILKSLDYYPEDTREIGVIQEMTRQFNQLHKMVCEKPLHCDMERFYLYLYFLKKVTKVFENSNVPLLSSYSRSQVSQSSLFVYAYINGLLITVSRIYYDIKNREKKSVQCLEDLTMCEQLFRELKKCAEYCLGEKLAQSNKLFYVPLPNSIANTDTRYANPDNTKLIEKERRALRTHITQDLCGIQAINIRIILLSIKKHEFAIELSNDARKSLQETGSSYGLYYHTVFLYHYNVR